MKTTATYIVTGTTRGIGLALADEITGRGLPLYSLSRREDSQKGLWRNFCCDLSNSSQVEEGIIRLLNHIPMDSCGDLVLINNAGVLEPIGPLERCNHEQIRTHLNVNLVAPVQLMTYFIRKVPADHGRHRIINVSSGAATHAYAGWALYCGTKAALNMITACVALEQRGRSRPVCISAVAPGVVDTAMQTRIRQAKTDDFPSRERFVQLKREGRLSSPSEVAALMIELDLTGQFTSGCYDLRSIFWEDGQPRIHALT